MQEFVGVVLLAESSWSSAVSGAEIPAVIVLPEFQGSEKTPQLTCVVSSRDLFLFSKCGGLFSGIFVKVLDCGFFSS